MNPKPLTKKKDPDAYHHGDLPRTLTAVAAEMLGEAGVAGFRLREACRRAGVTIGAAGHHFGSSRGLLTAVAAEGYAALCERFEAASKRRGRPVDRLRYAVESYARLARQRPGHFAIMFRWDQIDTADPAFARSGPRAFALLVDMVRETAGPSASEQAIRYAADTIWAASHGFVDLGILHKQAPGHAGLSADAKRKIGFMVHCVVEGISDP